MYWNVALVLTVTLWSRLSACAPEVTIGQTTIIGRDIQPLGLEFFGNIPFAEPPVGPLRLALPVPKFTPTGATLNASEFGLSCPQAIIPVWSEDCLTINVFRPAGLNSTSNLPVMVWIYGGGFYQGSSIMYDGSGIVATSVARGTPVVYAVFNYRLGALGFPQGSEAVSKGVTNLGLKDQLVALEWIQQNIATFGGDKTKVTVFGESTGSVAIAQHLLSPSFSGLSRAAILQSGLASSAFIFDGTRREGVWSNFVTEVPECANAPPGQTFDCIRSANISTVFAASESARLGANEQFPWWTVVDGPGGLIPDLPSKLYRTGRFAKIPFIAGSTLDEGTIFTSPFVSSTADFRETIIANITPSNFSPSQINRVANKLMELYPDIPALGSPYNTGNETFGLSPQFKRIASYVGDNGMHALRRFTNKQSTSFGVKNFGFQFSDPQPNGPDFLGFVNWTGVFHSADVPYVFGGLQNASAASAALSSNMMDYWISFAVSLDPNDSHGDTSRPVWNQYTASNPTVMNLNGDDLGNIPDNFRAQQMDYINRNALILRH